MKNVSAVRGLAVEYLLPAVTGAVVAAAIYKVILPVLAEGSWFRAKLAQRGFIPPLCMWLLWWLLSHVVAHYFLRIRPDTELLGAGIIPEGNDPLTQEEVDAIAGRVAGLGPRFGRSRLARRIQLALDLRKQGASRSEVREAETKQTETEQARVGPAYAVPNLLFWAIPILGFIGTVLEIGVATGSLESTLAEAQSEEVIKESLASVSAALGVAFDTTLVALLMAILGLLAMTVVRRAESRLLADIDDYVSTRLLSRLVFESPVEKLSNEVRGLRSRLDEMLRRTQGPAGPDPPGSG